MVITESTKFIFWKWPSYEKHEQSFPLQSCSLSGMLWELQGQMKKYIIIYNDLYKKKTVFIVFIPHTTFLKICFSGLSETNIYSRVIIPMSHNCLHSSGRFWAKEHRLSWASISPEMYSYWNKLWSVFILTWTYRQIQAKSIFLTCANLIGNFDYCISVCNKRGKEKTTVNL